MGYVHFTLSTRMLHVGCGGVLIKSGRNPPLNIYRSLYPSYAKDTTDWIPVQQIYKHKLRKDGNDTRGVMSFHLPLCLSRGGRNPGSDRIWILNFIEIRTRIPLTDTIHR